MAEEHYKLTTLDAFRPLVPPIKNAPGERSRERYLGVIAQFDVVNNPRYTPGRAGHGETYCNIFVWDVTSAMLCEIPHWLDLSTDKPSAIGHGIETNANSICQWLRRGNGWTKVLAQEAVKRANDGFPTVAGWLNVVGIGHVAMVIPSTIWSPAIAQAGKKNYHNVHVSRGFGARPIEYFTHD